MMYEVNDWKNYRALFGSWVIFTALFGLVFVSVDCRLLMRSLTTGCYAYVLIYYLVNLFSYFAN